MEDPVPDFPNLKIKDLPTIKTQYPNLLDHVFSSVLKETKASAGLIFNSFEELEEEPLLKCQQVFSPIPIFPLGPFHKQIPPSFKGSFLTQDQASISWLDTRPPKSVLHASFGSVAVVDRHEFVEMAWGLGMVSGGPTGRVHVDNCNHPFLWVVRPGMVSGSHWLEALPEGFTQTVGDRGCIVKWVGSPDGGSILDAHRMKFDDGEYMPRGSDVVSSLLWRSDGELHICKLGNQSGVGW